MERRSNECDIDAVKKLMNAMSSLNVNDDFSSAFKTSKPYEKFSPINLINKMAAAEPQSTICHRDIRFLIKYHLHLTSEERLNITSEGHEELQALMKKYNVEKKPNGDNITLNRIAAAFPMDSVDILERYKIERKFSSAMLEEKNAGEFPWRMRTQTCLSLVPDDSQFHSDPENARIVYAIIVFMYYENKIANSNKRVDLPMAIFEKVLNIASTIYKDSLLKPEKKRNEWNKVMFDYIKNKRSVDNLLKFFRAEIPEAEAMVMKTFDSISSNGKETVCTSKNKDKNPRVEKSEIRGNRSWKRK